MTKEKTRNWSLKIKRRRKRYGQKKFSKIFLDRKYEKNKIKFLYIKINF